MKNSGKTVSAVMFVYNESSFIHEMIDSILQQTKNVDEIIIVDDQSTDNTAKIINQYKEKYSFITYIYNPKKGKNFAFRLGLSQVKTDFFFICAGDDILFPKFVESMLNFIVTNKINIAYSRYTELIHETGEKVNISKKQYYRKHELLIHNDVSGYLFSSSSEIKEILNLTPDVKFEDWLVAIHFANKYGKVFITKEPNFYYRRHLKSATHISKSRTKYFKLINRDLEFYKILKKQKKLINSRDLNIIQNRIGYFEYLLGTKGVSRFLKIGKLFKTGVSRNEIIKGLFFKLFLFVKYPES